MRVVDYYADRVADLGIDTVFMITGGGAMHLNHAFGTHPRLRYVCNHHEQASAIAAEGYARISGKPGVVVVTSGPGGTNTLTGVLGQYLDSIPCLYLSGQIRLATSVYSTGLPLRQLGDQEGPIIEIVKPITKYAALVRSVSEARYHFEAAVEAMCSGRPGPVWLDVPLDVQAAQIEDTQRSPRRLWPKADDVDPGPAVVAAARETWKRLRVSKRPLMLAGNGVRLAGAVEELRSLVRRYGIPIQTAIGAPDLIGSDDALFVGRPSITGDRASNFIVQNCDVLVSIGARLGYRTITYREGSFARDAFHVMVDADAAELSKPTLSPSLAVNADAGDFLRALSAVAEESGGVTALEVDEWRDWCRERRERYPSVTQEHHAQATGANSYVFVERLSKHLNSSDIIVLGNGTANTCTFQAFSLKEGQRLFTNSGCATMGYDLPAAIGAHFASPHSRIVCVTGDGSLMMNLQELQTIRHHSIPLRLFVLNNDGYAAMRATQDSYFDGKYVGANPASGVSTPSLSAIAGAFGFSYTSARSNRELDHAIGSALESSGPVICEIFMDPAQPLWPKISSERLADGTLLSRPLEDMAPLLDDEEFTSNMVIKHMRSLNEVK
jgi:acetolactate synthase-1/2/3 large subunit